MKLSTIPKVATVFGGSGFVGRHVVRALVNRGYSVRVAVRRPDLAFHLQPLGNVGQIQLMQANLRYPASVERAVKGADVVINLVGILQETGRQRFGSVQANGAATVAAVSKKAGAALIHVSSIGANSEASSEYLETKGLGEEVVHENHRKAVILRPSIVFGPEDDFFNRFGAMSRLSPFLPLIGGGVTKFQPVYVGDVAEAVALAADGKLLSGKVYELGGPQIASFRDCMEIVLKQVCRSRILISIPWFAARVLGTLTGWLPGAPITADQVESLKVDNVVSSDAIKRGLTLEGMGVTPTPMAAILPSYMVQYRPSGQFTEVDPEGN